MQSIDKFVFTDEANCSIAFTFWQTAFESYLDLNFLDLGDPEHNKLAAKTLLVTGGDHLKETLSAASDKWKVLTYTEMLPILQARYLVKNERMDMYRLTSMRIQPGETLTSYVGKIRPLANLVNPLNADKTIIEKLISDPSISEMDNGKVLDKLLKPNVTSSASTHNAMSPKPRLDQCFVKLRAYNNKTHIPVIGQTN
jgi:hypothetical protein